ncbi:MAG TPA: DUF885 domain-containing protein [Rheinheimera sp.]|nr:DUF885 domain-containing protein [Rheinheimera sp.]
MRYSLVALSIAALLAGCSPADKKTETQAAAAPVAAQTAPAESESQRLNKWFDTKYEEQLMMSPIGLTFLGRKERNGDIDDMTEEAEDKNLAWVGKTVEELKANFDYNQLDLETKTSYDLWIYQYEEALEASKFRENGYVFTQMNGVHAMLPQILINFHKVEEKADMEAYIKRIGGIATAIGQLQQRAEKQAKLGIRPPKFAYDGVITQVNNLLTGAPFTDSDKDAPLWADAKAKIDALKKADKIDDAAVQQLTESAKQALVNQFKPAYSQLSEYLVKEKPNAADNATGVSSQPNGVAYYNLRLKQSTTTDLTAEQIHELGLKEVERLTGEMNAIKDKVGFKGDLKAFFKFIKTDPQFFYPDTDEGRLAYIKDADAYIRQIEQKLPQYFGILPKAPLVVKRVEAFREQPGAAQHYFPGTPDGKRPGIYYAHLSDMKQMPKNEMEAIAYHEGLPGHHMQISIAQELTAVPKFRTQAGFTAYAEGWGLYSELLSKEMGQYENPYSDFGRLITEMWRAIRLVVDTGMHAKGWTEQQGVQFFLDHSPVAEGAVRSEVQRYLVWPGQATAYKVGMLKILEMRAKAKRELGDQFDIRGFHDTILGGGALPMKVLAQRVDNWIASVKANKV